MSALALGIVLLLVFFLHLRPTTGGTAGQPLPPPTTGTSYRPLTEETERALRAIAEARRSLREDPDAAEAHLQRTATSLRRMRDYYLPLVDARARAYDARFCQLRGDTRRAARELETVEEIFLAASARDEHVARCLRQPLVTLIQARSEVARGASAAADRIEQLGREVNLLILKGDLALAGSHLENP